MDTPALRHLAHDTAAAIYSRADDKRSGPPSRRPTPRPADRIAA